MTADYRERELKFDVPTGWVLGDVAEVVPAGGRPVHDVVRLSTTYFDTAEHDLLRRAVTLRRRTGDSDLGWQLKVPAGDARTEIRRALADGPDQDDVPAELVDLTVALRAARPLRPVATLTTERERHRILGADDRPLAEIVVDSVHGTAGGEAAVASQWREVEVELADGDEALLARVAEWLRASGAEPSAATSKLARAIAPSAVERPSAGGLAELIAGYLDVQFRRLVASDVDLRRGRDVVHPTRTAIRRYRSALRVFGELLDPERASRLDTELAWYSGVLGRLRDGQVLRDRLDAAVAALPPELVLGPVTARIHRLIDADLLEAQKELDEVLAGERYFALLADLAEWRAAPPFGADRPAADAAHFLQKARRKVRRRLEAVDAAAQPDEARHRARKAAKRLRYTAELAEPELGRAAKKVRKKAKRLQGELGDRQDGVVAAEFLLRAGRVAGTTAGENGFTFGLLYERERGRAAGGP